MTKHLRVLIALDGSSEAERAIESAMPFVRARTGAVILASVLEPDRAEEWKTREAYLRNVADRLREGEGQVAIQLRGGQPAEEILTLAREERIGLIALTTHGRTGVRRLFTGSVTEEILRRSEVPLLVVPPGAKPGTADRVLVPVDGSERGERALKDAAVLARLMDVELDVVRVELPAVAPGAIGEVAPLYPAWDSMPYVREVCERVASEGVRARPFAFVGRAAVEIVQHAEKSRARFICMTTHGRTGLSRLLLGSVAEDVLRHAPCPVFVRRTAAAPDPVESTSAAELEGR